MSYRNALPIGMLVAVTWIAFAGAGAAMATPAITVSPSEGPMGTQFTVSGQGFEPNDTIFLEIFPVGAPESRRIGNISASATGTFSVVAEVGIAYAGPDVPEVAPLGGGQKINHPPGDYYIMAYPQAFGPRTAETLAQAPKVLFKVTASALPSTGGEPGTGGRGLPIGVSAGLLLIAAGVVIWKKASTATGKTQ
jgi:hypothetical protein